MELLRKRVQDYSVCLFALLLNRGDCTNSEKDGTNRFRWLASNFSTASYEENIRGVHPRSSIAILLCSVVSENQAGFRRGHSCESNLISALEHVRINWTKREKWLQCIWISEKLSILSITVSFWINWKTIGVTGGDLNFSASYRSFRELATKFKRSISKIDLVTAGVPQASILRPLLFTFCPPRSPKSSLLRSYWAKMELSNRAPLSGISGLLWTSMWHLICM